MSHYTEAKIAIQDAPSLVAALNELGFKVVEVHQQAVPLVGFQGDARANRANVVIRRQYVGGSSNDLGFRREADGSWTAIISEYDSTRYDAKWVRKVVTLAGVHRALREAKRLGQPAERRLDERGRIQVVIKAGRR